MLQSAIRFFGMESMIMLLSSVINNFKWVLNPHAEFNLIYLIVLNQYF